MTLAGLHTGAIKMNGGMGLIRGTTFNANIAGTGGAIYVGQVSLTITGSGTIPAFA